MQKSAIKDLCYGGLMELINNRNYYYHSSIGADYSHLTDDGKVAIVEFMDLIAFKMKQAEDRELDLRAKRQVMESLKGTST